MSEQYVQVPVSLIESIARRLGEEAWHPEDCPGSHLAYCTCAVGDARRALRALLSQPNPTAEPPRIEDMAPGTTFLANPRGWTNPASWVVVQYTDGRLAISTDSWRWAAYSDIDPSTIRDVTPPKEDNAPTA